jgi:hypothetical protein
MTIVINIALIFFTSLIFAFFLFTILANEKLVNKQQYLSYTKKHIIYDMFQCKRTVVVDWLIADILTSNFSNKQQRVVDLIMTLDPDRDSKIYESDI